MRHYFVEFERQKIWVYDIDENGIYRSLEDCALDIPFSSLYAYPSKEECINCSNKWLNNSPPKSEYKVIDENEMKRIWLTAQLSD